ncbi:cbb3-type cytochrome c oxidase N-terminal domain-containing protein [Flavitalea sp. BT771]|uniref:cbb3-type cytochrome c oxidase N-terminal domain-containing protein n=1 Tax=Flavitalea sp. BT771 TaxID=3063329 RepID=UPI0026E14D01|nr:cbb3-type cytochrome c oxidase N-terminal domain-containing protein [Flavitalea sp. BT771]MDO6429476.1 cbb3-type cytochrome c oxidase N-terminal domain-containing protein [Flavitalea sp. BT771]MDV6218396.1 cbb3-type cytochrome c oxidase N-terminal domain-containing protein [Flavitalea sp. BT771]
MKFIHYLEKISGVSIYGLSSLIIFGLFFLVMVIWAIRADKNMIEELRQLPLDKLKGGGKIILVLAALVLPGASTHAAGPPVPSSATSPFVVVAIIIIIILALAIALLANVLLGAAQIPVRSAASDAPDTAGNGVSKEPEELTYAGGLARTASPRSSVPMTVVGMILAVSMFASSPVSAEGSDVSAANVAVVGTTAINGVSDTAFYMISGVILLEVLILFTLLYNVRLVLSIHKKGQATAGDAAKAAAKPRISWWEKINSFKPLEQEVSLDLGHDYDGIRELDNRLPPWWLYGFYGCILFACVYMWRYHVAHSAPLSGEEYTISVQKAELQKAAFLKNAANLVDENTVKQLTAAPDLAAGQKVFETTCFACHGKAGEGGVGPNLTDEYWLHGGSVQEVFKSIKYGWPDKGMKSWKDDFSPVQIAQITSYVRSLQGTHPANAKAPQGTLAK